VVESQNSIRVLVSDVTVHVLRVLWRGASGIARIKVPKSHVLSTDIGGIEDQLVVVSIRRAHPRRLNTDDTLQGQFNTPHLVVDLVP